MTVPSRVMVLLASLSSAAWCSRARPMSRILTTPCRRQQQVVRLDVAMNHAALEGVLQAERRLPGVVARLVHRQRPGLLDQLGQIDAGHVFHDEQMGAVDLIGVEGANDVRMVELGGGANLAVEAAHGVGVVEAFLADELEGDDGAELPVAGLEDLRPCRPRRCAPAGRRSRAADRRRGLGGVGWPDRASANRGGSARRRGRWYEEAGVAGRSVNSSSWCAREQMGFAKGVSLPQAHRLVLACRGQPRPVGTPCHRVDAALVAGQESHQSPRFGVDQSDVTALVAVGDELAIRTPGHAGDFRARGNSSPPASGGCPATAPAGRSAPAAFPAAVPASILP